ncbi:MAG: hypothetical protein L3J97_01470 [Thermoplasmata archaeon]|nr:hypothetical protein [Thermoplasmata archaeon]
MSSGRAPARETERFEISRGRLRVYSERWPIKYLLSDHGICLGIDTVRCSFLFLVHRGGIVLQRRPVGDRVVEDLNYDIPEIAETLARERAAAPTGP